MQILVKNAPPVMIEAVVRMLPQQREVVRGLWGGKAVYAKKFVGSRAKRHVDRDLAGVKLLSQANIATPALLFEGETAAEQGYVAIFAAIAPSLNAEVAYAQYDSDARYALMRQLVQSVAQHHRAQLIQTDLYFKNFLVQQGTIYTLDGDGIRPLRAFNTKTQRLHNLATLFSKMDIEDEAKWSEDLYKLYCEQLGEPFDLEKYSIFWWNAQKIRAKVSHDYADKKVFRSCTDVKVTQNFNYFIAVVRDFSVDENTLKTLDQYLINPAQRIKSGRTCTIAKGQMAGRDVVVKRYNIKHFAHAISRAFRKSRAAVSWANAFRLIMANIATPKPLALVEERLGFLRKRAYFVSEYVEAPDIAQFFAQPHDIATLQQVALNVATLFYRFYLLKISHGDCKATNFKIKDGQPIVLDLDAMQAQPTRYEEKHIKDLKRFMRNWADNAEISALFKLALMQVYDEVDDSWSPSILVRAGID